MRGCSGGGACMVALGGHAWLLRGGMRGCSGGGAWLLEGHVWFYLGGMRGFIQGCVRGFIRGGVCMVFSVFSDTMRYGQ